jgi:hypothetical protein
MKDISDYLQEPLDNRSANVSHLSGFSADRV